MKKFAFLFPDDLHFSFELRNGSYGWECPSWEKRWSPLIEEAKDETEKEDFKEKALREKSFRYISKYFRIFNKCVNERYRKNNFEVNWVSLDNEPIFSYVGVLPEDRIILSGVNFVGGVEKENLLSGYPNFSYLVSQIGNCEHLRVGGFLRNDCVSKLAKEAHGKGLDVLVDEDLTDSFWSLIRIPSFRTGFYPSINFKELYAQRGMANCFEDFMKARKDKPWFYQDY